MAESGSISIRAARSLSADELAQVRQMKALCDDAEGLDLKLSYGLGADAKVGYDSVFLALAGGAGDAGEAGDTLVGYCSLDGDWENAEMCGLVHPDWRRQRVGFRLFEAARASFTGAGGRQLFAICEDTSASGRIFVRMLAGQRAFSEHRMLWRPTAATADSSLPSPSGGGAGGGGAFTVAQARPEDFAPLAEALAGAFDQTEERLHADLVSAAAQETERIYVARLDGAAIGGFRLSHSPDSVGIYAFGVDTRYQRQGWGRRMLAHACALAQAEGAARVTLEVDTDNAPAIALYQSSGFETITTYGYYIFSRTLLAFGLDLDETGHMREDPDADQ